MNRRPAAFAATAVLFAACGLALCGCAMFTPAWTTQKFLLDAGEAPRTFAGRSPLAATVVFVDVGGPFAGTNFVYAVPGGRWETDPYSEFLLPPGEMLTSVLRRWIEESGLYRSVALPGDGRVEGVVIETRVGELYGDFRNPDAPDAVLSLQMQVFSNAGGKRVLLMEQRLETRTRLAARTPEALVEAWQAGLRGTLAVMLRGLSGKASALPDGAVPPSAEPALVGRGR